MLRNMTLLAVLLTAPAMAEEKPARKFPERPPLERKPIECYCTNTQGARVEMGEVICLHVGGRSFLAQCQMSINVPIWREVTEGCTSS